MAKKRGINWSILVNGYDFSNFFKQVAPGANVDLLDVTGFQSPGGDREFLASFNDGKLSLEGFFSADNVGLDGIDDIFNSVLGSTTKQVVTASPENANAIGNRCYCISADETRYEVSSPADGVIMSNAEFQSSSGLGNGVILHNLTAETATGNNASVDNGAASTSGGAGHLHVTARSGTSPTLDVKIQHSSDNSVFVDLIVFAQKAAVGSERLTVTGTVNRYTRSIRTIGGTGPSFTYAVGFTRN